jgi:glycosyltransferase involved in cell wall biosynthesis
MPILSADAMNVWNRTCFMIDTLERGGAQNQLLLIARYLQEQNIPSYHLIVFREPLTLLDAFKEAGVNVEVVEKKKEVDVAFLFNLFSLLKKLKPRVVVTFLITADMWGRLIARIAGVPRVGCSVRSIPQRLGVVKDTFLFVMDKLSDIIVCNSKMAAETTQQRSRLDQKKVVVIYNGIPAGSDEEQSPKADNDELVIGLVARLVPLKDVSTLLKAFSRILMNHSTVKLVIVGDGPCRGDLENEAVSLGVADKVCFMGERLDVKEIIKGFDIGVLTSQYEGLSNAIMEYMQAGKPVVATNVGGNPELVEDGVNGYLFDYGNVEQLANILNKLISEPKRMFELGCSGRKKIVENFSIDTMAKGWHDLLINGIHNQRD